MFIYSIFPCALHTGNLHHYIGNVGTLFIKIKENKAKHGIYEFVGKFVVLEENNIILNTSLLLFH